MPDRGNPETMQSAGAAAPPVRRPGRGPVRTSRFNVRLLLLTLLTIVVVGPLLYLWHGYQVRRNATALGQRARDLYDRREWSLAANGFHRYLQLRPDDREALLLRAEAFDKVAASPDQRLRAVSLYSQAVAENPNRDDARLRLAELLFETRRYDEAAEQVKKLGGNSRTVAADRLLAAALAAQIGSAKRVQPPDAIREFETALERYPGDVSLSIGLAEVLRTHRDSLAKAARDQAIPTADATIDRMVSLHPDDPEARLARFRYRTLHGLPGAAEDLAEARRLAPRNPEVLVASMITAGGDRETAKKYAGELLAAAPADRRGYLFLAAAHVQENELPQAIEALRKGLKRIGDGDLELNRALLRLALLAGDAATVRGTLDALEPAIRRIDPSLPIRRRLGEELQVAEAQLVVLGGKPLAALATLKRLAASVTEGTDADETLVERERRWRILATAYSLGGMHDLAGASGDELVRLRPRSGEYRLLAAGEWRAAGDLQRAEEHYRIATADDFALPAAWLGLAEVRMDRQFRRPPTEPRDWSGVDEALQRAQTGLGDSPAVILVQATVALAKANRETVLSLLRRLSSSEDLAPAVLPRVAALFEMAGSREDADATIARLRKSAADPLVADLAEADLLKRRGQASEAIRLLETAGKRSERAEDALRRRLVELEIEEGSMRAARLRLRELRKQRQPELWVYETAGDLALTAGDMNDLRDCESELESLEGANGVLWRYLRAVRILEETRSEPRKPDMQEVTRLSADIDRLRPLWPEGRLLRGRIAERQGRLSEAADDYELALRSGARNLTAFQWLVAALYHQNRFADAASYIGQAGQIAAVSGDLSSLAVPAILRAGRPDEALKLARAAAELRPGDAMAQVWYAHTLAVADRPDEAEAAFRSAVKAAPKDIRIWNSLAWFYSRTRRQAEAKKTLEEVPTRIEMTAFERELFLARGYNLIGERSVAETHYRSARTEHPRDARLLEEIGGFHYAFDYDKSLEAFRAALDVDPKSEVSRRAVAALWGLTGSVDDVGRAVELLEGERSADPSENRRLEAALLLLRGNPDNYRKAVDLLSESIAAQEKPNPTDRLLLAKAYEELGQIDQALEQTTRAVEGDAAPAILAAGIEFLIRVNRLENAEAWIARLEKLEPAGTRAIDQRARFLEHSGRVAEIEPAVERFVGTQLEAAKTDVQRATIRRFAADLYTRTKRFEAAETQLREMVRVSPPAYEILAAWLADRGRVAEAVALCRGALSGSEPQSGLGALVRILTVAASRSFPVPDEAEIEKSLAAAEQSSAATAAVLLELGVLRLMQRRDADAITFYERALAREPGSIAVLNNLAIVLSEVPERQMQALEYMKQAMTAAPNSTELLDSKALVLIGVGKSAEAREILERLCQIQARSPRYRLHLATALYALGEAAEARRNIERASHDGLEREFLTPSERRAWQEIVASRTETSSDGEAPR